MKTLYPPQILADTARLYPLKTMITYGKRSYSYQDSWLIIKELANKLAQSNVKGNVLVSMPNSPEFIFAIFALFKIGVIPIPLNPAYTSYEMKRIIKDSGANVLMTQEKGGVCIRFIKSDQVYRFSSDELVGDRGSLAFENEFNPSNRAIIFYTSGSTGKMKGVVHTFASLCTNPYSLVDIMNITSEDTYFIGVPLFHLFGFSPGMITAIMKGAEIVMTNMIGSLGVIDKIHNKKVTVLLCNATMLKQLIYLLEKKTYDTSSLRLVMVSGSIAAKQLMTTAIKKFCTNTLNLYGTTETGIISQTLPGEDILHLSTTVGKPLPGIEIRVVHENNEKLPSGNIGEISCKTYSIFKEYHKMPTLTSRAKDSKGWYYTADMGIVDEEGYVTLVGRKSEMIVKCGFNLYPKEVELVLLQHPKIVEAAVVGIPDCTYGEIIRAVIIKKDDEYLTNNEILDHCRQRLIYFKVPDQIIIVKKLPLTSTGKIQKSELKKINTSSLMV